MGKLTVDSPIPYLLSDLTNIIQRDGQARQGDHLAALYAVKGKIDEIKADPRYSFMFSGMLVADTMADFIAKMFRLPANGKPISIIDVSRRAVRNHLGGGRRAFAPGLRLCDLGAQRTEAPDPAGLRGGPPLYPQREDRRGPVRPQDPRADRQGRP
ncbi:MAG: DUF87 domain-containing protein [Sphingobium sp.]|nr:DUF87 domain-containing protein [Sphingobium sp.]